MRIYLIFALCALCLTFLSIPLQIAFEYEALTTCLYGVIASMSFSIISYIRHVRKAREKKEYAS